MDFVALDFETANSFRGSPCEVALVRVRKGKVVDTYESFLYQRDFDGFNITLHGITPLVVSKAPEFKSEWASIRKFIGDDPVVAHYAAYDTGVIRDALGLSAFSSPITYFCTVVLSRQLLKLPSYRLPWVADALGVDFKETHRSLSDAMAVVEIVLALGRQSNHSSLEQMADSVNVSPGKLTSDGWKGSTHKSQYAGRLTEAQRAEILESIPALELYEDPDFAGRKIVFTGALGSMTRGEAHLRVMKAGGLPKNSVSKETNLLVFGHQEAQVLRPGQDFSNKMKTAMTLIESGADLEIVDEETFLQMLHSPEGLDPSLGETKPISKLAPNSALEETGNEARLFLKSGEWAQVVLAPGSRVCFVDYTEEGMDSVLVKAKAAGFVITKFVNLKLALVVVSDESELEGAKIRDAIAKGIPVTNLTTYQVTNQSLLGT